MKPHRWIFTCMVMLSASTLRTGAAELRILAAASLSNVLNEMAPIYQQATGNTLVFSFGASGTFARQLQEGAPADGIISADELRVNQLEAAGLLLENSRRILVENTLVLITAADHGAAIPEPSRLTDASIRYLAIGEPSTVPAGTYAKAFLQKQNLWQPLQGKLIPLDNVRAVLAAVESGNADAGFVYRTDAMISKKVHIAYEVLRDQGERILYPAAVVKTSKQQAQALHLIEFLAGDQAQETWTKFGFRKAH
jgi:molybdate transport system substrate-binding protein